MSANLACWSLPAAERRGVRGKSGVDTEIVKEPVIRKAHQVAAVPFTRLLERAGFEIHVAEGKLPHLGLHWVASELDGRGKGL